MGLAGNKIYFGDTRPRTEIYVESGFGIPHNRRAEVGGRTHFLSCPTKFINGEDFMLFSGEMYGSIGVTRNVFRWIPVQVDLISTNEGTPPHEFKHERADGYI